MLHRVSTRLGAAPSEPAPEGAPSMSSGEGAPVEGLAERSDDHARLAEHRRVVSYVRRGGRMRPNMREALERHRSGLVIELPVGDRSTSIADDARVDWDATFGRVAPRVVEIGTGHGENIAAFAAAHPDFDIVGFEVFEPALAGTVAKLSALGVTNVRLAQADGVQGLRTLFAPASLAHVITYFPDPWHKSRHHKRRLVNPGFADLVASRLAPGGTWRLATDWSQYAEVMRGVLDACPNLVNLHPGWAPRPGVRPLTKFEARGLELGRSIFDLEYGRPND